MIFNLIRITLGLVFVVFLPGYLLSRILFRELKIIERICLAFGLSVLITVILSFFLTAISNLTNLKAINVYSVWISLLGLCTIFVIMIISKPKKTNYPDLGELL